jgi:LuxR family maltose regulon positive regulatory protein
VSTDVQAPRLVWTKLHAPVRREHVARAPLLGELSSARCRLVLVRAPAGWGKSALLADWSACDGEPRPFAWLALDDGDDDPLPFLLYLVEALRTFDSRIGTSSLPLLLAPGVDLVGEALPVLVNELRELAPCVLVLDDYHAIEHPDVHRAVAYLLELGPPALTLAIATRAEPPLPVSRLRARGDMLEIDADRLRFSEREAEALLNDLHALALDPETVAHLHERTEGWVTGLFLAALSLHGREDAAAFVEHFAGDDRHIADYLCAEVLEQQRPEMRDFLLRTAILERFCPRLCEAVTGADGGARLLGELERSNLLLVPLDTHREWYRYHHLFGELLRNELTVHEPGSAPALHRRAAAWLLEAGFVSEAIHHHIEAGDRDDAGELIARHWPLTLLTAAGDRTIERWLTELGDDAVRADVRLCIARCFVGLSLGRMADVEAWLRAAAKAPLPAPFRDGTASVDGAIARVRAAWRWQIGDTAGALAAGEEARAAEAGTPWEAIGVACVGLANVALGDWAAGRRWMGEYARLGETFGMHLNHASGLSTVAACHAEEGDLAAAERAAAGALEVAAAHGIDEHWCMAHAHLARGIVWRARGDLAAARGDLQRSLELARRGAGPVSIAWALLHLAGVHAPPGAREQLALARAELAAAPDPGAFSARLDEADALLTARSRAVAPGEPLSDRELAVLRELATPRSQREIGAELYVSLNTVKSHSKSIFRKLGVSARDEAVDRARELGLL